MTYVQHPFPPIYNAASRILILGTIPSPQSRKNGFYYSHPQNAFWRVMSTLLQQPLPVSPEEKTAFLLQQYIAVWDVLHACEIKGAADDKIRHPLANDFSALLQTAQIQAIFTTGKKAFSLYHTLCEPKTQRPAWYLPSTSPANRRWFPYNKLLESYQVIVPYLKETQKKYDPQETKSLEVGR